MTQRKKRKKKKPTTFYESYLIQVTNYDYSYSFHIEKNYKWRTDEAYSEYYDLTITGNLLSPKIPDVNQAELNVGKYENTIRLRERDFQGDPNSIGVIYRNKEVQLLTGSVWIPKDAMSSLLSIV